MKGSSMSKPIKARLKEKVRGWRRRLAGVPSTPDWVQVEINNTCNLNCIMCPRAAMDRPARHMTLEEFRDIADKCRQAQVPRLRLFLLGEPLLHRDLPEMIAYAKQIGIPSVEFNTNAASLDAARTESIIDAGLDEIVFSLDGVDAETYEAIRIGAKFEEVTSNVEHFCKRRAQKGADRPRITVQTIVMESTRSQIPEFRARWGALADVVEVQCIREYHGIEAGRTTQVAPDDELRPCPALWEYMVILADLRVVPCCVDINGDMALANIAETDVVTLWHENARLRDLRAHHLRYSYKGYPLCSGCEFTNVSLMRRKADEASGWDDAADSGS